MSRSAPKLGNRSFRVPAGPPPKARRGLQPLEHHHPSPAASNFRAPVAVRTSKRKDDATSSSSVQLMDMDNTLFNAVDLDSIEQQIKPPPAAKEAPGSPSLLASRVTQSQMKKEHGKRSHSFGVIEEKLVASTPKRRKSTAAGRPILVLQMSMDGPELEEGERDANGSAASRSPTKDSGCSERRTTTGFEDDEDEDYLLDVVIPCGQQETSTDHFIRDKMRRLSSVHTASQVALGQMLEDDAFEVFTNHAICSQYMRLDQSVVDEASEKIDPILGSQIGRNGVGRPSSPNTPARDATDSQQHRLQVSEVQRIFENCERTLLDLTNIAPDGGGSQPRISSSLAAINWDEEIHQTTALLPVAVGMGPPPGNGAPRVSSLFLEKGPFFGLPNTVRRILRDFRGIDDLYDWQRECLALPAIQERRNLIYALPTSGGKTLVAEILMLREVICRLRNVIFIVPYVSLAQEKMIALSPFALELQFLLEEYSGGKGQCPPRKRRKKNTIFVCTIEKALLLLDSLVEVGRANEIGLIVIDELHMIGEQRRGACLEMMITKVQVLRAGIQIVGMSATIGNLTEVARFMLADVYSRDFRPVELKEFVKCGDDLYAVRSKGQADGGSAENVFGEKRALEFADCSEELRRLDTDHVVRLILEVIPESSCLVFCPTKSKCESLCALLANHLPARLAEHRAEEKEQIIRSLKEDGSIAPVLPQAFRVGVAYHHAGLTQDERRTIEDAYRAGILSLIVCTSTLAAGVNLPAKRVIIRSPYIGNSFLSLSRYKQMVGRAGRAGFGETGESILICAQRDIPQVCEMLCAPMDIAESSLIADDRAYFKSLILSAIGLDLCESRDALQALVRCTLLAQQAERRSIDLEAVTDETIVQLYQGNAIKARHDSCLRNPPNMLVEIGGTGVEEDRSPTKTGSGAPYDGAAGPTFVRVHKAAANPGKVIKTIQRTSPLEVNRLGKAAIRAGFNMEKAVRFYDEMKVLGERLCVLDEYDLLHLILLEDGREVQLKPDDFIVLVNQLTNEQLTIAERYGINNGLIAKILTRRVASGDMVSKMMRFVRVLIVHELWQQTPLAEVASRYHVNAGSLQTLMTSTAGTAFSLLRMCEEIPELWAFKHLLTGMTERLTHYCKLELLPLLTLPSVKLGRARQLFRAGYTTLASIARATSRELVETIEHLNYRAASQLILSAKAKLLEEVDALREQAEEYLSQLNR